MGTSELTHLIQDPAGIVAQLTASDATIEDITRQLFFRILHREPTAAEWELVLGFAKKNERSEFVRDIFWALVNSQHFAWVH